ncbi:hypothetical protein [Burkholderia sp. AU15512]|uniref:hypothetical protein n=1 Tax=Burkholderia sp. AU15512 TaxID=2015345 RepID=UPI00117DC0B1|nr:hypothetical protein [Burkholderia sp. AU15512]
MPSQTPRFLVENVGPNIATAKLAMAEAVKYCASNNIANISLVVPAKGHFLGGTIAEMLGDKTAKALHAGRSVKVGGSNVSVTLEFPARIAAVQANTLLLGAHLSTSDMGKLDDCASPAAIVYLPWSETDGKEWLSLWQPSIWGNASWQVAAPSMDPAVIAALESLQTRVNVATGLAHPSDKKDALETFRVLRQAGHPVNANEVRNWALRNSWDQRGAGDLEAVAKKYES